MRNAGLFSQLLQVFDRMKLAKPACERAADRCTKGFKTWAHFVSCFSARRLRRKAFG